MILSLADRHGLPNERPDQSVLLLTTAHSIRVDEGPMSVTDYLRFDATSDGYNVFIHIIEPVECSIRVSRSRSLDKFKAAIFTDRSNKIAIVKG